MDTHVKILGVLHIVLGALGLVGAVLLMLIFGGAAGIVGASGDADAVAALPIIGVTGTALVVLVTALSLPGVIIGIGLVQYRSWARIGGLVLSIFDLIGVPFGTILGVYGLWVLLSKETERAFTRSPIAPLP
ncbi:MAG: hypothetical protein ABI868_12720 [Acidobacteriota bacterium]